MVMNWENIKNSMKNELSNAADTTRKYFKIGKSKLDIMDNNKSINDTYMELGIEVDKQINGGTKNNIRQNPKVINLIEKIKMFKQNIQDDKLEIEDIKKGPVPQAKTDENANTSPKIETGPINAGTGK